MYISNLTLDNSKYAIKDSEARDYIVNINTIIDKENIPTSLSSNKKIGEAIKTLNASLSTVAKSGSYNDLSNKPSLAAVATSGSYSDLSNRPSLGGAASYGVTSSVSSGNSNLVTSGGVYNALKIVQKSGSTYGTGGWYVIGVNFGVTFSKTPFVIAMPQTQYSNENIFVGGISTTGCTLYMYAPTTTFVYGWIVEAIGF